MLIKGDFGGFYLARKNFILPEKILPHISFHRTLFQGCNFFFNFTKNFLNIISVGTQPKTPQNFGWRLLKNQYSDTDDTLQVQQASPSVLRMSHTLFISAFYQTE